MISTVNFELPTRVRKAYVLWSGCRRLNTMNWVVCCLLVLSTVVWSAPLDDYVFGNNPLYNWTDTGLTIEGVNIHGTWKGYILNMTSGSWLNESIG